MREELPDGNDGCDQLVGYVVLCVVLAVILLGVIVGGMAAGRWIIDGL